MTGRILITGGAGFIGSHAARRFLRDGWHVGILDNFDDFYSPAIKRRNIEGLPVELFTADIRRARALEDAVNRGWDVILHLAARAGVRPSIAAPHSYVDTNITGTLNVLEVAAKAGIPKVIFASSSSVYGGNHSPPFHEALALNAPMSPYAATKLAGEHLCATYAHLHGIRCVCLRFFTVYGPGQRPDLAIHKFTRAILDGQPITLYGDGQSRRDYTHVDDIAQGILLAAKHTAASAFEVFNLAAGKTTILADLVNLLEQAAGKPAIIERRPPQLGDMLHTSGDITKARQVLGYVPGVLLPDGLQTFLADFLSGRGR